VSGVHRRLLLRSGALSDLSDEIQGVADLRVDRGLGQQSRELHQADTPLSLGTAEKVVREAVAGVGEQRVAVAEVVLDLAAAPGTDFERAVGRLVEGLVGAAIAVAHADLAADLDELGRVEGDAEEGALVALTWLFT